MKLEHFTSIVIILLSALVIKLTIDNIKLKETLKSEKNKYSRTLDYLENAWVDHLKNSHGHTDESIDVYLNEKKDNFSNTEK